MASGSVREWHDDDGWGVLDAAETPGGCWVHFSALMMDGYRRLRPGELVDFSFESVDQDSHSYRAIEVRLPGAPHSTAAACSPSDAYRSTLTITLDDGTVLVDDEFL